LPKTLPPSRHRQRAEATAEANITAANSNEQIAASIDELRRDLAPKQSDIQGPTPALGSHDSPETPADHLEAAE
jgi:hypothetical protein